MTSIKRKRANNATDSPPPYIDLVSSDDKGVNNQPDACIHPHGLDYPSTLRPQDEVRAQNGYVWLPEDRSRDTNWAKCTYLRPVPTRGNCVICGRSGPLGGFCSNGCKYDEVSNENVQGLDCLKERATTYQEDGDLNIKPNERSQYRMILTPRHNNVIDAVHFAELMYKGVNREADHYEAWLRRTEKFRLKKHDKIPANEERWADPFVFQFQMDPQCDWWLTFNWLSTTGDKNYDCENPIPGIKKRYKSGDKKRRR